MKFSRKMTVAGLAVLLAGCGGGGGDDGTGGEFTQAPAGITGQGVYQGNISYGLPTQEYTQILLVLEDGSYYSMYGTPVGETLYASHLLQGTGTLSGGNFTSTDLLDFSASAPVASGNLSIPKIAVSPFFGEITENGTSELFQGEVPSTANYVYNQAPTYANLVGTWSLTDLTGASTMVDVATDKTFTGTTGTCAFSGTVEPRPSGKNVFNLTLTFGAAPCASPNLSVTGIAINYLLANGKRQLIMAGVDSSRAHVVALFGAR